MQEKIRVVFCTYPSLYSSVILKKLLSQQNIEVVGIVQSTRVFKKTGGDLANAYSFLKTVGWRYALYQFFVTTAYQTILSLLGANPFSARKKIKIIKTKRVNEKDIASFINHLAPDVLISAYFNQIISGDVTGIARKGAVNIHPSLLPDYKGVDPVFFGLLNQEEKYGVTLHQLEDAVDGGAVLAQKAFVPEKKCLCTITKTLFCLGGDLAIQYINALASNNDDIQPGVSQEEKGRYDSWPSKKNNKAFIATKNKYISWYCLRKAFCPVSFFENKQS
jgi:methionyl-tRNA formyltransferase